MKLLNKLIIILIIILFLLTGLILMTGVNPDLTSKIASLLYHNQEQSDLSLAIQVDDPETEGLSDDSVLNHDMTVTENSIQPSDQENNGTQNQNTYEVPDEEAEKFQNVGDIVKYVEEKIN